MKSFRKYIIWFLLLVLACKSPFSTREAEPPISSRSCWTLPHNPNQVLFNMQCSVFERNVENYIRCIVDTSYSERSFYFEPDPEVAANYPGFFINWNREKEQAVLKQAFSLVPIDSVSILEFTEQIREIIAPDTAVLVKEYRLQFAHTQSNLAQVYEGQVELWLAPDQRGEWSIYRWIDNGIAGYPSWSLLKVSFGG